MSERKEKPCHLSQSRVRAGSAAHREAGVRVHLGFHQHPKERNNYKLVLF